MPPIRLSDSELAAVMAAARPIDVNRRDAFLQDVATALASCGEIGPGAVHRANRVGTARAFRPAGSRARGRGAVEVSQSRAFRVAARLWLRGILQNACKLLISGGAICARFTAMLLKFGLFAWSAKPCTPVQFRAWPPKKSNT